MLPWGTNKGTLIWFELMWFGGADQRTQQNVSGDGRNYKSGYIFK